MYHENQKVCGENFLLIHHCPLSSTSVLCPGLPNDRGDGGAGEDVPPEGSSCDGEENIPG